MGVESRAAAHALIRETWPISILISNYGSPKLQNKFHTRILFSAMVGFINRVRKSFWRVAKYDFFCVHMKERMRFAYKKLFHLGESTWDVAFKRHANLMNVHVIT